MASILTKIGDVLSGGLVGQIGEIIDKTSTSDEERMAAKLAAQKAVQDYELAIGEQVNQLEAQLTARQSADMASDSWLSKNVRPMVLLALTSSVMLLAYLTIFFLPAEKSTLLEPWIELMTTIMLAVYSFYFGGRTIEKFQTIKRKGC
jgi:hypothetical protein